MISVVSLLFIALVIGFLLGIASTTLFIYQEGKRRWRQEDAEAKAEMQMAVERLGKLLDKRAPSKFKGGKKINEIEVIRTPRDKDND